MAKDKQLPPAFQVWVEARKRYSLSHAHIQMARELGLNPKKFGKLANHDQEPWKTPFPQFIEELYCKRFGKERPDQVRSIEQMIKERNQKKAERKEEKQRLGTTLEIDPGRIKKLAKKKEKANWEFRSFLKRADLSDEALDAMVLRLYREVAGRIDCRACGNCCKYLIPFLTPDDVRVLARHLHLPPADFMAQYLVEDASGEGLRFKDQPCPFHVGNSCTVYASRPRICRTFPHLEKNGFRYRLNQVCCNCAVCPIVYNVYEQLKKTLSVAVEGDMSTSPWEG